MKIRNLAPIRPGQGLLRLSPLTTNTVRPGLLGCRGRPGCLGVLGWRGDGLARCTWPYRQEWVAWSRRHWIPGIIARRFSCIHTEQNWWALWSKRPPIHWWSGGMLGGCAAASVVSQLRTLEGRCRPGSGTRYLSRFTTAHLRCYDSVIVLHNARG